MTPSRIRVGAILGSIGFALLGIVLAIIGAFSDFVHSGFGCPGCSDTGRSEGHGAYYLAGAGLCVVGAIACAFFIRKRPPPP